LDREACAPKLAALLVKAMENNNDAPTSEVGSAPPPAFSEDQWRIILQMQNQNLLALARTMQASTREQQQTRGVTLPKFFSDTAGADASKWSITADIILTEQPLDGSRLIMALSEAMVGSASRWLTQITYPGIKCIEFKELFLRRYENSETPSAMFLNLLNSRPTNGECLAIYASRLVTTLTSNWKNKNIEEIAVSIVLAHLANVDNCLERIVFTSKVQTRSDLQSELGAFTFKKHRNADRDDDSGPGPDAKKRRILTIVCHFCGKPGHKIAECRAKMRQKGDGTSQQDKPTVTCFKCGQPGHFANQCSKKKPASTQGAFQRKTVNQCFVPEPTGVMMQLGETYPISFDSGAECSLIKEKICSKLAGKRFNSTIMLKGIGDADIYSTLQILSQVTINENALQILFHVVQDNHLKSDIVIGREILKQGFNVTVSQNKFKVAKAKAVNICSIDRETVDLTNLDTELCGTDKNKLIKMLENYSTALVKGTPSTRVTTGEMKIRLIDPTKTVQRRPYRLSPEERDIVREKLSELLKCNIIRSSCSPFASPMLLVKKKNDTDRLCVDYRELNSNTIADRYPLPLISDQIARLRGANYFTCLDMASGFHQISIHPDSIEYTAFVTPDGQYEFLTMPFGLKNAPSVFQRAVMRAWVTWPIHT